MNSKSKLSKDSKKKVTHVDQCLKEQTETSDRQVISLKDHVKEEFNVNSPDYIEVPSFNTKIENSKESTKSVKKTSTKDITVAFSKDKPRNIKKKTFKSIYPEQKIDAIKEPSFNSSLMNVSDEHDSGKKLGQSTVCKNPLLKSKLKKCKGQHTKNIDSCQSNEIKFQVASKLTKTKDKNVHTSKDTAMDPLVDLFPYEKYPARSIDPNINKNLKCLVSLQRLSKFSIHSEDIPATGAVKLVEPVKTKKISKKLKLSDHRVISDQKFEKLEDNNGNSLAISTFMDKSLFSNINDTKINSDNMTDCEPLRIGAEDSSEIPSRTLFNSDINLENIDHLQFEFAIGGLINHLSDPSADHSTKESSEILSRSISVNTHTTDTLEKSNIDISATSCTKGTAEISSHFPIDVCAAKETGEMASNIPTDSCAKDTSELANNIPTEICGKTTSEISNNISIDLCTKPTSNISGMNPIDNSLKHTSALLNNTIPVYSCTMEASQILNTECRSSELPEGIDCTTGRRRTTNKAAGEGEISDKCCGHWFPHYKAYLNHLMSLDTTSEAIRKRHERLLEEVDMNRCKECSKWIKKSGMPRHLRRIHNILTSNNTFKIEKRPIIQSVCSLKQDSTACPLSKKKNISSKSSTILCHITASKTMTVSSVSDLPFSLKPIVMLKKSLSPYKSDFNSIPRIVKVESLSSNRIDSSLDSLKCHNSDSLDTLISYRGNQQEAQPVQKDKNIMSEPKIDKHTIHINNTNNKVSKFCYSESLKNKCFPVSHKNRNDKAIVKGQFCVSKAAKKKNGNITKRFQLSNGYFLQDSSDEHSDTSSSEDESYHQDNDGINDGVPTVELDLFTLPSVDEDSSVFLTDPSNPDLKVYASMDAIFVGDADQVKPTSQIGYVTDTNNVVYINPEHFLFPNVENSKISLDSVKLSSEDIEMLSKFDGKLNDSPSRVSLRRRNSSPLKKSPTKKDIESSPILKLQIKDIKHHNFLPDRSQMSPLKLPVLKDNGLSLKTVCKEKNINFKFQDGKITSKIKIDPIKKALGLFNKQKINEHSQPIRLENINLEKNYGSEPSRSKIRIDDCSKLDEQNDTENPLEEFFTDRDVASPIDTTKNKEMNGLKAVGSSTSKIIDKPEISSLGRLADGNIPRAPIVIKVGDVNHTGNLPQKSDRKFTITVHNSINKSLLKEFPNYWGPPSRKNVNLKGNFNYKPTSESFHNQFSVHNNNFKSDAKFKRVRSNLHNINQYQPKKEQEIIKKPTPPVSTNEEQGSLLKVITLFQNELNYRTDLDIDLTDYEEIGGSKVAEAKTLQSEVIVSAKIAEADTQTLSLEEEMKSKDNDLVYIDENGTLRSPSGRDINKGELDEEALLINMIENYAETLETPCSPLPSPKNADKVNISQDDWVQEEKYLDILKGKGTWDTQLLFSPLDHVGISDSTTDTASDNETLFDTQTSHIRKRRRKENSSLSVNPNKHLNVNKGVKLKISLKNPNEPVVLPEIPTTSADSQPSFCSFDRYSVKRKHDDSQVDTGSDSDDIPLQAIVLKSFKNSPIKRYSVSSASKINSRLLNITGEEHDSQSNSPLQVRPLHTMTANSSSGAIGTSLSPKKSLEKSLKNINKKENLQLEGTKRRPYKKHKEIKISEENNSRLQVRPLHTMTANSSSGAIGTSPSPKKSSEKSLKNINKKENLQLEGTKRRPYKKISEENNSRLQMRPLHTMTANYSSRAIGTSPSPKKSSEKSLKNINKKENLQLEGTKRRPYKKHKKTKISEENNSRDIRSYFSMEKYSKSGVVENDFEGFETGEIDIKPKLSGHKKRKRKSSVVKPRNVSDIRTYLSTSAMPLQSSEDRAIFLQKRYEHIEKLQEQNSLLDVPRCFEGFTSNYAEGVVTLRTLQTYVDVLNMQNMFCTNYYSLPLDVTCEWDEETINHELELF